MSNSPWPLPCRQPTLAHINLPHRSCPRKMSLSACCCSEQLGAKLCTASTSSCERSKAGATVQSCIEREACPILRSMLHSCLQHARITSLQLIWNALTLAHLVSDLEYPHSSSFGTPICRTLPFTMRCEDQCTVLE